MVALYERDLNKLKLEIELYGNEGDKGDRRDESLLWQIRDEIKNSAGNLCLHLCGNLQHYIGFRLGGFAYHRNRDLEFAAKDIPLEKLLAELLRTKQVVLGTLEKLDNKILVEEYPEQVFGKPMTTVYFLIHLAGHLNYHLGQINYHRRLITA